MHDHEANILIGSLIILIGVVGLIFNAVGLFIVKTNPVLSNSFGFLCFSHCIANGGVCFIFAVFVGPVTITQDSAITASFVGKAFGQINIFFWDVCVYCHLAISINRFVCIVFPLQTPQILTTTRVRLLIFSAWVLGFCHVIPYFWSDVCNITYSPSTWLWDFAPTECGYVISTYTDCCTSILVFVIIVCLDMTSLYYLHQSHNQVTDYRDGKMWQVLDFNRTRRAIETRFFIQTCVQTTLFFYELSNFYFITNLPTNKYGIFFTSTFAWLICHALDGLVVIIFNTRTWRRRPTVSSDRSRRPTMVN